MPIEITTRLEQGPRGEDRLAVVRRHDGSVIGSGQARPVGFGPVDLAGRLVVASDGLLAYTAAKDLVARVVAGVLADAAAALIDGVRLRSGALPDDLALALCERVAVI